MKSCSKCGCVSTDPKSFVRIGYEQLSKKDKYLCPNCADDYFKGAKNTEQANQPDNSCEHSFSPVYRCVHCGKISDSIA